MIDVELHADLPPAGVRRVTRWVFSRLEVDDVLVRVFSTEHLVHHGHIYVRPESAHPVRILAYVPAEVNGYGSDRGLRGGPPIIYPQDWQESLVCILAHEGTHVRQWRAGPTTPGYQQNRRGKIIYVRGRVFREVHAEWAEYIFLKMWRERRRS